MYIDSLVLKNFRNQAKLDTHFTPSINLIIGNNGTGKTSILEAIHTLSTTKSFKAKKEIEVVMHGMSHALIKADIQDRQDFFSLELRYEGVSDTRIKKQFLVNDVSKRANAFIGMLLTTFLTTDIINTFTDKAATRRKFFNQFLCQLDRDYLIELATYEKVIKNKNRLLKMVQEGSDRKLLDYWNMELIKQGSVLVHKRSSFIRDLQMFLDKHVEDNALLHKSIHITYESKYNDSSDIEEVQEKLSADIVRLANVEIESGRCLVGPHRDDYSVSFNNKNIEVFASRGEQKFSISFLLYAIAEYITERKQTSPVMLIDDLHAEMDKKNFDTLMNLFFNTGYQVILTAIHKEIFEGKKYNRIVLK